ncbi:MAG: repressor LexA [Anaerolineae bacterium]|nr:repressor LexA [Anaerolineae bacterium]
MGSKQAVRQEKILKFIKSFTETSGFPPTVREIGKGVGISSTSLVSYYLSALEEQGLITRERSVSRGICLVETERETSSQDTISVPYYGYIVASAPLPVEALAGDETVELSRALFDRDTADLFALRVKGNSMIDALINDGDLVILRQQPRVENGEMAAVWVDDSPGATTLKKVYYEGKQVRLQPANPTMLPIYVKANQVQIQGKVVMVIRNLEE